MDVVNHTESFDPVQVTPWPIAKGDDGVIKDCILVARTAGNEMVSVALFVAEPGSDLREEEKR